MLPLCFVLMPFAKKPAGDGRLVDFDSIYELLIKPAVVARALGPTLMGSRQTDAVAQLSCTREWMRNRKSHVDRQLEPLGHPPHSDELGGNQLSSSRTQAQQCGAVVWP